MLKTSIVLDIISSAYLKWNFVSYYISWYLKFNFKSGDERKVLIIEFLTEER